jgi:predicted neuraminidase
VGNAILLLRPQGEVWLVYVSVTIGGWSGSHLNLKRSRDGGRTWSQAERLVTSPFFNLSTLVRGNPLALTNGLPAIPAYHEFIANIPEIVMLNNAGRVIDKMRIGPSAGRLAIQPTIAVLSESAAVALMRPVGTIKRVYQSRSSDGGRSWTLPRPSELNNPGAPVGVLALDSESLLLVFNNDTKSEKNLTLAFSADAGLTWDNLILLDELGPHEKRGFEYPYLTTGSDGTYHVVYTHRSKNEVRHIQFNAAWVRSLLAAAGTGSDGIRHPCLAC